MDHGWPGVLDCGIALLITVLFLTTRKIELSQSGQRVFELVYLRGDDCSTFGHRADVGGASLYGQVPAGCLLFCAIAQTGVATTGCLLAGAVLEIFGVTPRGRYWGEFEGSFPFAILISLMIGLSMSAYETLRFKLQAAKLELSTRQVEQERAYKLLAEAQLSSLESRIHPHFLFNTLNSIAALIPSDPVRAEDTVGKLASLLRFSLNANQRGLVPLSQELKIVRDYLEIEKTRFGSRCAITSRFRILLRP
jgi:hypothetical protein